MINCLIISIFCIFDTLLRNSRYEFSKISPTMLECDGMILPNLILINYFPHVVLSLELQGVEITFMLYLSIVIPSYTQVEQCLHAQD